MTRASSSIFLLSRLQGLDQGHVTVDRQAVGVEVQVELIRIEVDLLPGDAETPQEIRSSGGCGWRL